MKTRVSFAEQARYTLFTMLGHGAAFLAYAFLLIILAAVNQSCALSEAAAGRILLFVLLGIVYTAAVFLPYVILWLCMKSVITSQYKPSEDSHLWIKSAAVFTLPGEIFRFVFNLLPIQFMFLISSIKFGAMFAMPANWLWTNLYVKPMGRTWAINSECAYIAADFLTLALIYLVYLAVHMVLVLLLYRWLWKKAAAEHEAMMQTRMENPQ